MMLSSCSNIRGAFSSQSNGYLYADMTFKMDCEKSQHAQLEQKIEVFLRKEGFSVLGYDQLEHYRLLDMRLVGLYQNKHVIEFQHAIEPHSPPDFPRRYGVVLWTEPLTPRASELESKLERFASEELKCEVRFVERRENGAPSVYLFKEKVREIEKRLQLSKLRSG